MFFKNNHLLVPELASPFSLKLILPNPLSFINFAPRRPKAGLNLQNLNK
jgi:hypothetical protein